MPSGSLSLAEIADRLSVLEVRCTKCDRRGRYRTATQVERYGADFAGPDLREKLSEPHRVCRRLQLLRDWSYDKTNIGKLFT